MAVQIDLNKIRVMSVARANKRRQMCRAIPQVTTKITVFADDDVVWPTTIMPWVLAPFEDTTMGAVGTSQRLIRPARPTMWTFLGSLYLERRNFDCSACLNMDGGLPCLSGRTVAYRTRILQDENFAFHFTNETWRQCQLNADDDNFMTRWVFRHGWKIKMQYDQACEVQTTLENGPTYLKQCLRWVRSNWRSNLTSLFVERHYWRTQPWTTYAVFQTTLTAWAVMDPILFSLIFLATRDWVAADRTLALVFAGFWIFGFAKTVKLVGHFGRYPKDLALLPISILFGYAHGIIKLIGLCTLYETAWGSREGADEDDRIRMIRLPPYMPTNDSSGPEVSGNIEWIRCDFIISLLMSASVVSSMPFSSWLDSDPLITCQHSRSDLQGKTSYPMKMSEEWTQQHHEESCLVTLPFSSRNTTTGADTELKASQMFVIC
ncbi:hypothetical protein ANO11243_087910 [Dothideomycetidae sp. 11243]|nr:hypothetical protein ANO11243_087910 [fungal sp. No.11243]